uniref:HIG1 domain family member 2A, mitochondrial n=1 Tax=Geotrypetes seraphini TaxID=260995 RepID=A0A6P8PNV8_GEOSA|nr:HIG1 domain family member 2A, mitochondrial [Geotrypetes seraphini]
MTSGDAVMDPSGPPDIEGFSPQQPETFGGKLTRKWAENPFVPVGCLATAGILTYGLIAFKKGKTRQSQLLMRARILAQGFTIAAIMVGVVASAVKARH